MKTFVAILISVSVLLITMVIGWWWFLGPISNSNDTQVFVVTREVHPDRIPQLLQEHSLVRHAGVFSFIIDNFSAGKSFKPGGYRLRQNMNSWEILDALNATPDLEWVTINKCQRKEQIGERIAEGLDWSEAQLNEWNTLYTEEMTDYLEGVYYPDTYLIPRDEPVPQVAQRFIDRFNEKIAFLNNDFLEKNVKWTTGLKIASLIARETDSPADMKLISGIIWNRLNQDMLLQIDSTMQYTLGKHEDGSWWGPVDINERLSDSPYNSYLYKGLPPTPICSPSIEFIEAAIDPDETECLFYLHDSSEQIHCASTYEGHLENIDRFLSD